MNNDNICTFSQELLNKKIVYTQDGSHTLYDVSINEHYHSINGAIQESKHVFIKAGIEYLPASIDTIELLEVGMGTGLNVFLTFLQHTNKINYTAIENNPVDETIAAQLNYASHLNNSNKKDVFKIIHTSLWNEKTTISESFQLLKLKCKIEDISFKQKFHLIYYDAFSPGTQPELWTLEIFEKLFNALQPLGILVTYCAKGEVKRIMRKAGFIVEAIPGPPGKREMIRAIKK